MTPESPVAHGGEEFLNELESRISAFHEASDVQDDWLSQKQKAAQAIRNYASPEVLTAIIVLARQSLQPPVGELPLSDPQRLMDLVRYQRHELHEANLITDKEFAALVTDSEGGKRVARLEGYDATTAQLAAAQAERDEILEAWNLRLAGMPMVQSMLHYRDRMNDAESKLTTQREDMIRECAAHSHVLGCDECEKAILAKLPTDSAAPDAGGKESA